MIEIRAAKNQGMLQRISRRCAGSEVALGREVMEPRALFQEIQTAAGGKCAEIHQVQSAVGDNEHLFDTLQWRLQGVPDSPAQPLTSRPRVALRFRLRLGKTRRG